MKRKVISITAVLLIFVLSLSISASAVTPRTNNYIDSVDAGISAQGSGTIKVNFSVCGTSRMTTIGATSIKIYKYGGTSPVYTFNSSSYSSMLGSNRISYGSSVSYSGTSGTKYYAVVTFYAKNSNGSSTETYTTGYVTA